MKIKIIGAGSIGNHLAQAARRMGWDVAIVDRDPEALRRTKEEIYPKRYGVWDENIKLFTSNEEPRGGFDIICIGTPPDSHIGLAKLALDEKPKILQIEKPLCTPFLQELNEFMVKYANHKETAVIVGYDHGISKSVSEIISMLDRHEIGDVETIDVEFREHWQGIFSAHPWLKGPQDSYLGFWKRGGGASGEHSHALHLWQLFASHAGFGKWIKVGAAMEIKNVNGAEYDLLSAFSLLTEKGKVGRVIQDVVTLPVRKKAFIQGDKGFMEWICGGHPEGDLVRYGSKDNVKELIFKKKRPDDFYQEILHMQDILDKKISPEQSPISLESGIEVMRVIAVSHKHRNEFTDII